MIIAFRNVTPCSSVGCDQHLAAACFLWRQQTPTTSINLHGATFITICRETLLLCLSQYHLLSHIFYICYSLLSFFICFFHSEFSSFICSFLTLSYFYSTFLSTFFVPLSFIITPPPLHTHVAYCGKYLYQGFVAFHPNTAAGNVRGVNFYKGWFIRETLVCSLKLILYQKFSLPLATRLMKLRPALIKSGWVTLGVQNGIYRSRVLL